MLQHSYLLYCCIVVVLQQTQTNICTTWITVIFLYNSFFSFWLLFIVILCFSFIFIATLRKLIVLRSCEDSAGPDIEDKLLPKKVLADNILFNKNNIVIIFECWHLGFQFNLIFCYISTTRKNVKTIRLREGLAAEFGLHLENRIWAK